MSGDQGEAPAFDIGVDRKQPPAPLLRRRQTGRRPLPVWAIAAAALLIGWLLGTLMNDSSAPDTAVEPPAAPAIGATATTATAAPSEDAPFPPPNPPVATAIEGPVEAVYEQTNGSIRTADAQFALPATEGLAVVSAVPQNLGAFALPSRLEVIVQGRSSGHAFDQEIAGPTQAAIGHVDHRMIVVEDKVLFIAEESVMSFDLGHERFPQVGPVELTSASHLLPGSEAGHVWAIGADLLSIKDIDARSERVRTTYDLSAIGTPLASHAGGLVVAPANGRFGQFALWSPRRGLEKLWSIDESAVFLDAASNSIVMQTPLGIASYNTVTGALHQTNRTISVREEAKAFVSPDGARLAVIERESVSALPTVVVIDLQTGEIIDEFETASEAQVHWISEHEVLSISPRTRPAQIVVRDTSERASTQLVGLNGPAYWVTAVEL